MPCSWHRVRGVDAAGEGRHHPAATDRRQAIVLADDPVAVLHGVDEPIEHLRLGGNRPGAAARAHVGRHQAYDRQKEIAPGHPNGRCASMNYQANLHRKSSGGQSLWTAIRVLRRALETEQNSWTAYLAHPNYVVLFPGRAHHEQDEAIATFQNAPLSQAIRRSVSTPWRSTYPPIERSLPRLGHYPPSATNLCRWSTRAHFVRHRPHSLNNADPTGHYGRA